MNRLLRDIGLLVGLAFAVACTRLPKEGAPGFRQSPDLSSIDSLMWRQPDSAFAQLLQYADTAELDSLDAFDRNYFQLLVAELLYKNYYAQSNRPELKQAVAYYDSLNGTLADNSRSVFRHCGLDPQSPSLCDLIPFLSARTHYINGVGYYENDSAVEACAEYLKALEVMEDRFEENELVGKRAQFMALAHAHLADLFSSLYLHEQAIYFGKLTLDYYEKYEASPLHVAWVSDIIGLHYEIMDNPDSAVFYYNLGLNILPDTCNLSYRDIAAHLAFLSFKGGSSLDMSLKQLKALSALAENRKEYYARCSIIGEMYYIDKQFDSAWAYLNPVFMESQSISSRKLAAERLVEICETQGKLDDLVNYTSFLAPFATQDEDNGIIKTQLAELYNLRLQKQLERQHKQNVLKQTRRSVFVFVLLLMVLIGVIILYRKNKRKQQRLKNQIIEEQYAHAIKQKALSERLKQSNKALKIQRNKTTILAKEIGIKSIQINKGHLDDFMNEKICCSILTMLDGKQIKREAKSSDYPELHLTNSQLHDLSVAVEKHFSGFEQSLTDVYPKMNSNAMNQCLLYLLNIEDVQIAALLSCDYSTIKRRSARLKQFFRTEKELRQFIRELVL